MGGGGEAVARDKLAEQEGKVEDYKGDNNQDVRHPSRHSLLLVETPGESDQLQGCEPHGSGQPGDRVRPDADVAADQPDHDQHGAQHDAAEHDRGGAHYKLEPDLISDKQQTLCFVLFKPVISLLLYISHLSRTLNYLFH